MKKLILTLIAFSGLVVFTACHNTKEVAKTTAEEVVKEKEPVFRNVSAEEFKSLLTSNPGTLVDVRTAKEFRGGYIAGAKNIDFYGASFKDEMATLNKDLPVYVYCQSGVRSEKTMLILQELGFKEAYNLIGGYRTWPYKFGSKNSMVAPKPLEKE
ncbi:MAG TPA: rhodanese-like domain-containing protein [Crocinitomix sp.]|nr:rhodanese-like domain-containing protein [Crocinitomix sp.]